MEIHNQLQITSSRLQGIATLLQFKEPGNFPSSGLNIFYDLGQIVEEESIKISGIATELEHQDIEQGTPATASA